MNILLFSKFDREGEAGGVTIHVETLAEELVRQGHRVTFLYLCGSAEQKELPGGIPCIPVPCQHSAEGGGSSPSGLLKNLRYLRQVIRERHIQLVHCHYRLPALYMRLYRLRYRIPVVYTLHLANVPYDFLHRSLTFMGEEAIGVSTEVSRFMVEKLRFPKERVTTVFNGISLAKVKPLLSSEKEPFFSKIGLSTFVGGGLSAMFR